MTFYGGLYLFLTYISISGKLIFDFASSCFQERTNRRTLENGNVTGDWNTTTGCPRVIGKGQRGWPNWSKTLGRGVRRSLGNSAQRSMRSIQDRDWGYGGQQAGLILKITVRFSQLLSFRQNITLNFPSFSMDIVTLVWNIFRRLPKHAVWISLSHRGNFLADVTNRG